MTDLTERKRLWVGNLDERLSEANLLKILKRYGEITQFDFLFHTSGPKQGKPRGYCFVSFKTVEEAVGAIAGLDGKNALGKKLLVKWAHAQSKIPSEPIQVESNHELNPDKLPAILGGQSSSTTNNSTGNKNNKTS
ncbi:putative RNA-binding protein 18, partial [Apostichopus japonicus]